MNIVTVNDGIGDRGRKHVNVLVSDNGMVAFNGQSIPGAVRVLSVNYDKAGPRWSKTTWEVELSEGIRMETLTQEWGTGCWLNAKTWSEAVKELREKLKVPQMSDDVCRTFIRIELHPKVSMALDQESNRWDAGINNMDDLLAAQKELALVQQEAVNILAEAEMQQHAALLREQAAATSAKVAQARELLKKGVSLADLKALLS